MITADVRDWVADQKQGFTQVVNGPLFNTKREKLMSIMRGTTLSQPKAIVGDSSYSRLACNCIIHWNDDYKETEEKAYQLYEFLMHLEHPVIGGHEVVMINMRNFVPLDKDANNIYEFAIDFEIIYKRLKRLESENE